MLRIGTAKEAQEKVWNDTQRLIAHIQRVSSTPVTGIVGGIALLRQLREETYEDLNQVQHEHMILLAADWLIREARCDARTEWSWNPRQTGDNTEPDLRGYLDGTITVSAEITTSKKPDGVIDTRMAGTLQKLSQMQGALFYFVRTDSMSSRARTKTKKDQWPIEVIKLPSLPTE
jgi:hypothetical protein